LELGMDMEADLGIDSIKKVEIMGAMRQALPSMAKADPESFAEARTLGQVAAYLGTLAAEATTAPF
jgi:acyl carrier protein